MSGFDVRKFIVELGSAQMLQDAKQLAERAERALEAGLTFKAVDLGIQAQDTVKKCEEIISENKPFGETS